MRCACIRLSLTTNTTVIPCYDAVYDANRPAYHLLLADLSTTHDQPSSWTISDYYITQTVNCLARLHAHWWEHPRLNNGVGELATVEWLGPVFKAHNQSRMAASGSRPRY